MSLGSPLLAVVVVRLLIAAALLMSTLYVEVQVYSIQRENLMGILFGELAVPEYW